MATAPKKSEAGLILLALDITALMSHRLQHTGSVHKVPYWNNLRLNQITNCYANMFLFFFMVLAVIQ